MPRTSAGKQSFFASFFSKKEALTLAFVLSGCTLIPDYHRPASPVAVTYPDYGGPALGRESQLSADRIGWRDFFRDPALRALIEAALRNNRDLRVAALNIATAQAQYRAQVAGLFPQIDLTGSGAYGTLPAQTSIPTSSTGIGGAAGSGATSALIPTGPQHVPYRYFNAGVGFTNYELDLFGRVRSQSRQAFEQALGYDETRTSMQITLVSEVANAWLTVLADRELLRLTRETVASEQRSLDLTVRTLQGGTNTLLAVRQAQTALQTARANLSQYARQEDQDTDALVLLLGQPVPADLPHGRSLEDQGLLTDIPAGLPSELLARRPDVRAAEHDLIAANANIGAARAAFFPSITLTANGGVAGSALSKLVTRGATTFSIDPQVNIPIFTFGLNAANLALAKRQRDIQVAQYEKAIQTAFREVADALAGRATYADQVREQQHLVDAAADSVRLSQLRFTAGVDTFLPVLDAQRTLYSAQQGLLQLRQAQVANLVTLYKALGGGWTERTVAAK